MTRVVITGDRHWPAIRAVEIVMPLANLAERDPDAFVVLGDCPTGVDALALTAVKALHLPYRRHEANWGLPHGAGGPVRNGAMLDDGGPDAEVWYFHDDLERSKGTRNCVEQARKRGMKVLRAGLDRICEHCQGRMKQAGSIYVCEQCGWNTGIGG